MSRRRFLCGRPAVWYHITWWRHNMKTLSVTLTNVGSLRELAVIYIYRSKQNCRYFADDMSNCIVVKEIACILIRILSFPKLGSNVAYMHSWPPFVRGDFASVSVLKWYTCIFLKTQCNAPVKYNVETFLWSGNPCFHNYVFLGFVYHENSIMK